MKIARSWQKIMFLIAYVGLVLLLTGIYYLDDQQQYLLAGGEEPSLFFDFIVALVPISFVCLLSCFLLSHKKRGQPTVWVSKDRTLVLPRDISKIK